MRQIVTAILGGGQGTRLSPLTTYRAKPAVPLAGKFRLIDIPISNSLHAGIDRIYVMTQFNSASLHRHIAQTYRFDVFSSGFVNILAAEQGVTNRDWYQGTADAVRQNLPRLRYMRPSEVLVLSGDQLYLMNVRNFVRRHRDSEADLTVAVSAVPREQSGAFGVMRVDQKGKIVEFVEKPKDPAVVEDLVVPPKTLERLGFAPQENLCLASMGIYVFKPEVLDELLNGTVGTDFGREIIPNAVSNVGVYAFGYPGYWRDIGTIPTFHKANLELAVPVPPLDLFSPDTPIYTHPRFLPGTKINNCSIQHSLVAEGSILSGARISESVIGIRSIVRAGSIIERSVVMGANRYEWSSESEDIPALGIGRDCLIHNAILDLDSRIGDGVKLINADNVEEADGDNYAIRGGVIVVPSGSTIPDGTVI
ncbi:MAG: glucose-1-phosphate adenylyltransferase [Acidobacteriota bacterium]